MPRTADHEHRDRLLDDVARDLVDHGLAGASLDRLARGAGTSARMLVHHFGSRRALLGAALARARGWELERARDALPPTPDFVARLAAAWPWFSSDETRRYFRLFSEVAAIGRLERGELERGEGDGPDRSRLATEWLSLVAEGFAAAGRPPAAGRRLATVVVAQLRGLFLDLDATGDVRRVRDGYLDFVALLDGAPAVRTRCRRP